jgi:Uma2 family endonuclease
MSVTTVALTTTFLPTTGPVKHLWTVSEFQRMGKTRFLDPRARMELIEGELFDMAPIGSFHAGTVTLLAHLFARAIGETAVVSVQNPIDLSERSEPQPDLMLLRPNPNYYLNDHPHAEDVLLLIEVSDSTVQFDRKTKVPLYARHGIPEVWLVVGPRRRHIEVYRDPQPERGGYRTQLQVREGMLTPTLLPEAGIRLEEVFPG